LNSRLSLIAAPVVLIAACAVLAGCAGGVPATLPLATNPPTSAAATVVPATNDARTEEPATASPEIVPIEATFAPDEPAPEGAIEIIMSMLPTPNFAPAEITAPAGDISLFLNNPDAQTDAQHDLKIGTSLGATSAASPYVRPGHAGVLTLTDMQPGTYAFWCSFLNHAALGMQGVLTVTP
jgi:plastocyanin